MEESNVTSYSWRELSEEEYFRYEKQNMLFYHAADIIIIFLFVGMALLLLINIADLFSGFETRNMLEAVFLIIAAAALWYARKKIRRMGLDDIEKKNLCACEGTYIRLQEETRTRSGSTRYDYYAIVGMPDGGELKIETSLSAVEKMVKGEQVTVIRPKGVTAAQRMDIMVRGK